MIDLADEDGGVDLSDCVSGDGYDIRKDGQRWMSIGVQGLQHFLPLFLLL
jgi:hypothetical protein